MQRVYIWPQVMEVGTIRVTIQVKNQINQAPRPGVWCGGRVWRTNRHICERACKARRAAGFPIHGPEAGTLGMNGWPITA